MLREEKVRDILRQNYVVIPMKENEEIDLYPEELELLKAFFKIKRRVDVDEHTAKQKISLILEKKVREIWR